MPTAQPLARSLPRLNSRVNWGERVWDLVRYSLMALVLILTRTPIYWIFSSAFKTDRDFFSTPPSFLFQPTLASYAQTLSDLQFWRTRGIVWRYRSL